MLTSTILPALVLALAREKPNGIDVVTENIENNSKVDVAALKNKVIRGY